MVICRVIFLHLPDRNGLRNLTEMQSMKSKVIVDTKPGRGTQTRTGKPPSQAAQACQVTLPSSELCRRRKGIGSH